MGSPRSSVMSYLAMDPWAFRAVPDPFELAAWEGSDMAFMQCAEFVQDVRLFARANLPDPFKARWLAARVKDWKNVSIDLMTTRDLATRCITLEDHLSVKNGHDASQSPNGGWYGRLSRSLYGESGVSVGAHV